MQDVKFDLKTVIAICLAIAGAVGWIQEKTHNFRIVNMTERVGTNEENILEGLSVDAEQNTAIRLNGAELGHIKSVLDGVAQDIKTLLAEH